MHQREVERILHEDPVNPGTGMTDVATRRGSRECVPAIAAHAAIGDGRAVALVASDGTIDWLCLPNLDSPSVFASILDQEKGGSFRLAPVGPFESAQRYLPETNVLETTFVTSDGVVRVTDAMLLPDGDLAPARELVRQINGESGHVAMKWLIEPRFGYGMWRTAIGLRKGVPVATAGSDAMAVRAWNAGAPIVRPDAVQGSFQTQPGSSGLIALGTAHQEPLVMPSRSAVEGRLESTIAFWRGWVQERRYEGRWRDAVLRSALMLKLLFHAPSGAIAAAPTASLPESLGGERNWDYRLAWIRDSAFTLEALQRLGQLAEAEAFFWWVLHASQLTHPRLAVLYQLDGTPGARERTVPFAGYQGSQPVRVGNAAGAQVQLDIYGALFQAAWLYARGGGRLDSETGRRLAHTADLVCQIWRQPDSGIWEVRSAPLHFSHSKMMCWVALDRAIKLANGGWLPSHHVGRWQQEASAVHAFVETNCWSERKQSYVRSPGSEELDAALLSAKLMDYEDREGRLSLTIDAVRRELSHGPLLHRYTAEDGLQGEEGAFLTCSFWLVDALARDGRIDDALVLMEELLALSNDVGLYAEEIDPTSGAFLGNFPQGLVHLALINAAVTIADIDRV